MSKAEILEYFNDINYAYNNSGKHDSLSNMLDEFKQKTRNKAIDEFAEKLKDSLAHNYRHFLNVDTDGFEWITTDAVDTHIQEIAKKMKGE